MKIKNFVFILTIGLAIFSCSKDDNTSNFDAAGQAVIDDASLVEYLETHYLNEDDGGLWTISNGICPDSFDDAALSTDHFANVVSVHRDLIGDHGFLITTIDIHTVRLVH